MIKLRHQNGEATPVGGVWRNCGIRGPFLKKTNKEVSPAQRFVSNQQSILFLSIKRNWPFEIILRATVHVKITLKITPPRRTETPIAIDCSKSIVSLSLFLFFLMINHTLGFDPFSRPESSNDSLLAFVSVPLSRTRRFGTFWDTLPACHSTRRGYIREATR